MTNTEVLLLMTPLFVFLLVRWLMRHNARRGIDWTPGSVFDGVLDIHVDCDGDAGDADCDGFDGGGD